MRISVVRRARQLTAAGFVVAAVATLGYWAAPPGLVTRTLPTFAGLVGATLLLGVLAAAVWAATALADGA
jgi:hypothetical protein